MSACDTRDDKTEKTSSFSGGKTLDEMQKDLRAREINLYILKAQLDRDRFEYDALRRAEQDTITYGSWEDEQRRSTEA
jgi:hypothetical protein